jgi:hypothetical protein
MNLISILGIPSYVVWITGITIVGFFVINFMLGPRFKKEKIVKEKKKSASEIHAEISQKILKDPELVEHYFGSPANCTRSVDRS